MAAHGKNIQLYLMDGKPRILAEKIRPEYIKRQGCMVLCQELAQIKMRFSDAQLAIFCSLVILR
jgi:hypothetical protein